jgi:hypothetical protein
MTGTIRRAALKDRPVRAREARPSAARRLASLHPACLLRNADRCREEGFTAEEALVLDLHPETSWANICDRLLLEG